jgi:chitinase
MNNQDLQKNIKPIKQLSYRRVSFAIILMGGLVYGTVLGFSNWKESNVRDQIYGEFKPWFAAYVDVTSVPLYSFEKLGAVSKSDVVLSFIVSAKDNGCLPTWGGYYTMNEAAFSIDLDRRIARLQQQNGKIAISFGGALNSELALSCNDEKKLLAAYESVINRYNINTIDLDLENESLRNLEAMERRSKVIAQLQEKYRNEGKSLAIWLTLPVAPSGLTQDGTDAVASMLKAGVDLAGVNVMTMDYGQSRDKKDSMFEASQKALIETHRQLGVLYELSGLNLTSESIWRKIGATPMIGQNDVIDEIFTLDDAIAFNQFSIEKGIGRMSMWSANRDIPCGQNYVDLKIVSDLCSGVSSPAYAFTNALSNGFDGDLIQNASLITSEDSEIRERIVDDPETSPYQIWKETGVYLKGAKVVRNGNVYEAKWWTKNDMPDNPVLQSWETPWQLIGPVLPGEKPTDQLILPSDTFPQWSGYATYDAGDRVLFDSIPFRAKWWNQGESPAASAENSDSSPWVALTQDQILEILKVRGKF